MTRITILISSLLLLNACGTLPAVVGTTASSYESYKTITYIKGGVDLGLAANDKKTTDAFVKALDQLDKARIDEGKQIYKDFHIVQGYL